MELYNIAVAPNSGYVNYTIVLMESLFESNPGKKFRFFVLYSQLKEEEMELMEKFVSDNNSVVEYIHIDVEKYKVFQWKERFSVETYFRLELQDILPEEIERVLYLDGDMIVCSDIEELYHMDFEDKYLIACGFSPRCERGDEFNAGMILFDMKKMRKDITFEKYVDLAEKLNGNFYQDQGLLNEMFGDTGTRYVSKQKYNFTCSFYRKFKNEIVKETPDFTLDDIVIMHYAGPGIRPWQVRFEKEDEKLLQKKNVLDMFSLKGYIVDELYLSLVKRWWKVAENTPVYQILLNQMYQKKSEIYREIFEVAVDSKDYSIGYSIMKKLRKFKR